MKSCTVCEEKLPTLKDAFHCIICSDYCHNKCGDSTFRICSDCDWSPNDDESDTANVIESEHSISSKR